MKLESYKKRFREHEWAKLEQSKEFMLAFNTGDFDSADAIAGRILYGEARNAKEHKALRHRKSIIDEFY